MPGLRERLFSARGYAPIPFLLAALVFARPTNASMAWGVLLVIAGECIRFWGVAFAGSLTRVTGSVGAPDLVVAGPFAYVRNPLYVGNVLMYIGVAVMSNALSPWLAIVGFVYFGFQYSLIVSLEESFLAKEFGATYDEYRSAVPRFVPRLTAFRSPKQADQSPRWREALRSERRTFQAIVLVVLLLVVLWGVQLW